MWSRLLIERCLCQSPAWLPWSSDRMEYLAILLFFLFSSNLTSPPKFEHFSSSNIVVNSQIWRSAVWIHRSSLWVWATQIVGVTKPQQSWTIQSKVTAENASRGNNQSAVRSCVLIGKMVPKFNTISSDSLCDVVPWFPNPMMDWDYQTRKKNLKMCHRKKPSAWQ